MFEQLIQEKPAQEIIADAAEARDLSPSPFASQLLDGVEAEGAEIDGIIAKYLKGWSLPRLPRVTHVLLRLAVYEILRRREIPVSVTINEAVELAKVYAGQEDAAYLNGVLSTLEKQEQFEKDDEPVAKKEEQQEIPVE